MELMEAIKGRRSIRKYKADMPSDEDIGFVLEAARWAPSWANTQCWEFILVKDSETKRKLADVLSENNPARRACEQAPLIVAACAQKEKSGYFKRNTATDKGDWLMFDVALALQNLTLAAHSRGLGTVHVGFFDSRKAAEILQVPRQAEIVELLPFGYPDTEGKVSPRKPIEEFVFYNKYGQRKA